MDSKRTTEGADAAEREAAPVRTSAVAYPFLTRREIAARVEADAAFAAECALVLEARTQQRAAGGAPAGKPWGWMSSERVVAGGLVAKVHGASLTESDQTKLSALVRRYSRQLANHCRGLAIEEDPALSAVAAKFGALPTRRLSSSPMQAPNAVRESALTRTDEGEQQLDQAEPAEDDELSRRIMAYIEVAPGVRTEGIARALGVTTAILAPTLRMLVQAKRLCKQGVGRGTRYGIR